MIDVKKLIVSIGDLIGIINGLSLDSQRDIEATNKVFQILIEMRGIIESSESKTQFVAYNEAVESVKHLHYYRNCAAYDAKKGAGYYIAILRDYINNIGFEINEKTNELESVKCKLSEKELAYDDIIQLLLNTEVGRNYSRNNTFDPEILSLTDAAIIISDLDKIAREAAALDEIPFGVQSEAPTFLAGDLDYDSLTGKIAGLEALLDAERIAKRDLQVQLLDFCGRITADIAYEFGVKQ